MRTLFRICSAAIVIGLLTPCAFIDAADDAASPSLTEPVTYEVDFSAVVTPPYNTEVLKVWMPIPQSDSYQQVSGSVLTTFPELVEPRIATESVHGNKFAYFEFHEPAPLPEQRQALFQPTKAT